MFQILSLVSCGVMNFLYTTLALLFVIGSPAQSARLNREYNIWYQQNAVLYGMSQTAEGLPVLLSFFQPGNKSANMLVSYMSEGTCKEASHQLKVNGHRIPATYNCISFGQNRIEHFAVNEAQTVNGMFNHLKSDFTLVLQGNIKVWAANIKKPRYGLGPMY